MCRWLAYTGNPIHLDASFHHLHDLYPDDPRIMAAGEDAFLVLSEPLVDLPGWWEEIPESTAVVARGGEIEQYPFKPHVA